MNHGTKGRASMQGVLQITTRGAASGWESQSGSEGSDRIVYYPINGPNVTRQPGHHKSTRRVRNVVRVRRCTLGTDQCAACGS